MVIKEFNSKTIDDFISSHANRFIFHVPLCSPFRRIKELSNIWKGFPE